MAKLGGQSCVLRAVPAGSKATTSPAFAGPRLLIGDVRLVTVKGGPPTAPSSTTACARPSSPAAASTRRSATAACRARRRSRRPSSPRSTSSPARRGSRTRSARSRRSRSTAQRVHLRRRGLAVHAPAPSANLPGLCADRARRQHRPGDRQHDDPRVRDHRQVRARPDHLAGEPRDLHELHRVRRPARPHDHAGPRRPPRVGHRHVDEHRRPAAQAQRHLRERRDQRPGLPVPLA